MASDVFEPELLTHTEVCDWLIALLGTTAVSVAHTAHIAHRTCGTLECSNRM
jgi:hypothetical protein